MPVLAVFLVLVVTAGFFEILYNKCWNYCLHADVMWEDAEVTEGDITKVTERLENKKWLPMAVVNIKFKIDRSFQYLIEENSNRTDYSYRSDSMALLPYQRVIRTFEVTAVKRGYYQLDAIEVVSTGIFYSQVLANTYPLERGIFVYPRNSKHPGAVEACQRIMGSVVNNHIMQEDPFEFRGIRDYTRTDSRNKINWKASARSNSLKVNQFFSTHEPYIVLLLSVEMDSMLFYENLIEESIRVVRNFVEKCLKMGIPVKIISNAVDKINGKQILVEAGGSQNHLNTVLKKLALLDGTTTVKPMAQLIGELKEEGNPYYILLSSCQRPELQSAFEELAGSKGEWMIFRHYDMKEAAESNNLPITYVEVEW